MHLLAQDETTTVQEQRCVESVTITRLSVEEFWRVLMPVHERFEGMACSPVTSSAVGGCRARYSGAAWLSSPRRSGSDGLPALPKYDR